jgi:N-acetylglucosamine-6-phosphate deacetylase
MQKNKFAIKSKRMITPLQEICDAIVLVDGKKIIAVGQQKNHLIPEGYQVIDVEDKILAPGFIDIHNHGGMGMMVSDRGEEAVHVNAERLVETGCTSWLPTVNNLNILPGIVSTINNPPNGAQTAGIHMEGPFLTPKAIKGIAGIDDGLQVPSVKRFMEFYEASQGHLKLFGLSVELLHADEIILEMRKLGVVPAIAHSTKATYEQFMQAVELGIRHVTHTYNVMTGLHHRKPGVVGGALTCDQVTAELISDCEHVSPVAMDILIRCKGTDKVCIISDNTSVAGLPDGEYEMSGRKLTKKDGVTRYADSSPDMDHTMAGSEWPINYNVSNLIERVGVRCADAIKMATLNPARVIGIDNKKGSIEPGKDADLIVVDQNMNVYLTMVKGSILYNKLPIIN